MNPILIRKNAAGQCAAAPLDLADALIKEWDIDAHTVQYEGDVRRNKESISESNPLVLTCELYDFDNKEAPDVGAWALECLSKLPADFIGYRTAGGFRALTLREEPFLVHDKETWEDWRQHHGGRAEALGAILGAAPDHATDEPNRLFRLPLAKREDGKDSFGELFGDIGCSALTPAPYERRAASDTFSGGNAKHSKVGAAFVAAGRVQRVDGQKLVVTCPWSHEHSGKNTSGTFVDDTEDHMGHFVCSHSHCQARHSLEALAALGGLPAVAEELSRWPEPSNILEPYARVDAPVQAKPEVAKAPAGNFALMTVEDMMAAEEALPWVVQDLISVGEPTLFVGGAASGKTSAVVEMALAVATGKPVWGMYPVAKPGPVVHIDYEQGKTLRRTYHGFAKGLGLDAVQLVRDGLLRIAPLPREQLLDMNVSDTHLGMIGKDLVKLCTGASLCVLNSLTAGTNKVNENDAKIAAVFNLLARVTEITGCAMVVLHHSGRGEQRRARGSSAIDGAVQTIFEIDARHARSKGYTTWEHVKDRPAGGLVAPFELHWTNVEGVQKLAAKQPEQPPAVLDGSERPEDRIEKAILWVMEHAGLSQKTRILERVRGKQQEKFRVWDDMVVRNLIDHVGSRWMLAPGVRSPAEQPESARNEGE